MENFGILCLIPPLVAVVLALKTKQTILSLFIAVWVGSTMLNGYNPIVGFIKIFSDFIIPSMASDWNAGLLVLVTLSGGLIAMLRVTGSAQAFAKLVTKKINNAKKGQIVTALSAFIFSYTEPCLILGTIMRPVTDTVRVSRAKLAYLIDATAAPICIIAPISSWAAAVSSFAGEGEGINLFIRCIPYNFYAIFTLVMMFALIFMRFDYATMAKFEMNAVETGDLFTVDSDNTQVDAAEEGSDKGIVLDLVFPVVVLVISCVLGMVYTGGFFSGAGFVTAFSDSDASVGLSMGSLIALVIIIAYYSIRRTISFTQCMSCVPEGMKAMASPILVLTLAWSLKAMTDSLGLAEGMSVTAVGFIPAALFLIACILAFASGTSWGTFGILIPIGLAITESHPELATPIIAACMAGAVYGDHCSPISDTTIMASAGASCNHISHVSTQLPYATTVAVVAFISYLLAGFIKNPIIPLIVGVALLIGVLVFLKGREGSYKVSEAANRPGADA